MYGLLYIRTIHVQIKQVWLYTNSVGEESENENISDIHKSKKAPLWKGPNF